MQFASSGGRNLQDNAEVFKSVARDLPVIGSFVGTTVERETSQALREAGVLLCADPAATMSALSLLYTRRRMSALPKAQEREPLPARAAPRDWAEIMSFCEESGVTPAKWLVLGPEDRAATACAGMKYPLVVKVLPSESEHKTELGLVKLRVRSPEEVDAHAAEFRRRLGKPAWGCWFRRWSMKAWKSSCPACVKRTSGRSSRSVPAAWRSSCTATSRTSPSPCPPSKC